MILDTNALSAWAEGDPAVRPVLASSRRLVLPVIVLGEYLFGIKQSRHLQRYERWLAENLPKIELVFVVLETARYYGQLRLELKYQGTPIPANDAWIAAVARQHQLPILSRDMHFDHVKDLRRIPW